MADTSIRKRDRSIGERITIKTCLAGTLGCLLYLLLGDGLYLKQAVLAALGMTATVLVVFGLLVRNRIEIEDRRARDFAEVDGMQKQLQELFAMTDMLQSANGLEDAGAVMSTTASRLLPGFAGALYVFNNSRDRLDRIVCWNMAPGFDPPETLLPSNCWALKRGKPHINDCAERTLPCSHHLPDDASIELPMVGRGSLHGLLMLSCEGPDAHARLVNVSRVGRALADSMSLALSNIALNDTLKTQSLRDPLTGLYNRRYMEDALERTLRSAERDGLHTSVVMIDLDNFKQLNDEHGHAKGDAVLRDVAAHLVAGLRPSDVVSRYGGEELLLILPATQIEDAWTKSELLREGIERLSNAHEIRISASFGVASLPGSVEDGRNLVAAADTALYEAKAAGRNCVRLAKGRAVTAENLSQPADSDFQPRLVRAEQA